MTTRKWIGLVLVSFTVALICGCASVPGGSGQEVFLGDDELRAAVYRRLQDDDVTGNYNIGVSAEAGRVVLRGTVPDITARHRAIGTALGTPGVREVVDDFYPR